MKRAGALPALLLLAAAAPVTPIDSDIASGRMVTISPGRTLNLRCTGKGSPTVILEAGFQGWSFAWNSVQPRLAAASRVCSYDRAGMGLSPAAPGVRDGAAITTDLAALLKAAGERPPYILVGHSAGGLHMRRFAATFPKQVVGMVLVDPSVEDQFAAPSAMRDAILARYRLCAAAAQAGRLPATEPDLDRCVPAAKPGAFNAQLRALAATAGYQDTLVSEYAAVARKKITQINRDSAALVF